MEELTQEEKEQQELEAWDQASAEVFEGVEPKEELEVEPEITAPPEKEVEKPELDPALQEMINGLKSRVENYDTVLDRLKQAESRIGSLTNKLRDANAAASQSKDAPTVEEMRKAIESQKEWETLKEEFPEWAEKVDKRFSTTEEALKKEIESLKSRIPDSHFEDQVLTKAQQIAKQIAQQERDNQKREDIRILQEKYPGFSEIVKGKDFQDWLGTQPHHMHVRKNSDSLADALYVMDKFHARDKARRNNRERLEQSISTPKGKTPRVIDTGDMVGEEAWNSVAQQVWK